MTKFGSLIEGAMLYITANTDELWPWGSARAPKKLKGVEIYDAFLVHRWPSAMKYGSFKGLANGHLFYEFAELSPGVRNTICGDMPQSFTHLLVVSFWHFSGE